MKKDLVNLLQTLIRIDSQNPPGNEKQIILFIRDYLKRLNVPSRIYEFKKDRLNLVCFLPAASGAKKKILFTPHVDTVPVTGKWRFPPLSANVHAGRLYGRGATDCKVNVAAALYLIKKLKEEKTILKNIDLVFVFTGDEETGSYHGIIPIAKFLKNIDYAVVLDADDFNIIVAQKGLLHLRVELCGKEAHGAYPHRGVNAVEKSVKILSEILQHKFSYRFHRLLKKPTINVGRFMGGDKVNIVAGHAFFELDIRYLPSMHKGAIIDYIEKLVRKQKIKYKIKILAHQEPIEIKRDTPSVKLLCHVLKKHKIKSSFSPSFGATVINFLQEKGIESFAFGFGSKGNAHIKNESVKISNLCKAVTVLEDYVKALDVFVGR